MTVLVPVSDARTNDATVEQAVDRLGSTGGTIHLIYTETEGAKGGRTRQVANLLERSAAVAANRGGESVEVVTAYLAQDVYLPSPRDHADEIARYAETHDVDLVFLDPHYSVDATDPILQPLDYALRRSGLHYEYATVPSGALPPHSEIVRGGFVTLFAFTLYLIVAPAATTFDLSTGIVGSVIAGALFRNVTFETTPRLGSTVAVFVRGALYLPYLLGKIIVANIQISYLVLHPSLPIESHIDRVETGLSGGMALTALANSLTLTPGTLTIGAGRDELLVHSITPGSRREVLTGQRRRAIEFVYYGRSGITPADEIDITRVETVAGAIDVTELDREETDD